MASTPKIPPEIAGLLTLGATLAVSVGGGTLLGHWAGKSWGWEPWGTLVGAAFGIAVAGVAVYRAVRRLDAGSGRQPDDGKPPKNPNPPPS